MSCKFLFLYFLPLNVYGNAWNKFVVDYYNEKSVPNVVGFPCNAREDNLLLLKDLSKLGIATLLNKLTESTAIPSLIQTKYYKLGIFLDIRCHDVASISSIFFHASEHRMFDEQRYWLMAGADLDDALKVIDDRAFGLSTNFVIAVSPNATGRYRLYDAYSMSPAHGSKLNVTFLGDWSQLSGMNVVLSQTKLARRANLHRLVLRAAFWQCAYKPSSAKLGDYFDDYTYATRDGQSKFGYHMLFHLSEMYNFTLEPYETAKWTPGDTMGPIGRALMNNSADFTGTPLTMNIPRTHLLKFVHQDWPFRTCFIFRNPQPRNIKVQEIFRPFENDVWYLMTMTLFLTLAILLVVLRYEQVDSCIGRFSNSFIIIMSALCQQGTDIKMERISTRITFLCTLVYSLLMYNYYSASVVSARLDEPIFKINDSLAEFGKLRLTMASEWMVYLEFFLKRPDWDTQFFYQNFWLKMPKSQWYSMPETGIKLVKQGGYAYHTHPDVGYEYVDKFFDNREICELMEVHVARPVFTTFAVTFNSTLVEMSRVGLTKMHEVGLRQRQVKRWSHRKPVCRSDVLSASSINIYEFAPHLILLIIGVFMASFVCAVEVVMLQFGRQLAAAAKNAVKFESVQPLDI